MAKKRGGPGTLVLRLDPEEAKAVLIRLLKAEPRLRAKAEAVAEELLSEVNAEDVAFEIEAELESLGLDDLNGRAGTHDGVYTGPDEAAWELIREAVEPFLNDLSRRVETGRKREALEICKGIVLGLYRAKKNDATSWAPDAPLEIAREAVDELNPFRFPRDIAEKLAPAWAAELGG